MKFKLYLCLFLLCNAFALNAQVQLDPKENWSGTNRTKIDAIIQQYGINSPTYNANHKPVAAFDWDNTLMKNDIGEATLLWMVSAGKLKRPHSFSKMNPWLTKDALAELEKNCGGSSEFLPTRDKPQCADTLLTIYHGDALQNGANPWKNSPNPELVYPRYFFYAQLFAGYKPAEISQFTEKALQFNLSNAIGSTQKVGNKDYTAYVRIYSPMKNLLSVLKQNGFDVWIISASLQPSVEVVAQNVGIAQDHVIGVRLTKDKEGKLTDAFEGWGPYADNTKQIISNRLGKRCWLNKVVFNRKSAEQLTLPAPIIFAAGDSEGDLIFLMDAQGGRLVINKNNTELLCHAYQNKDGQWLINPMFIEPKPLKREPYQCTAFHIPDQRES